MFYASTINIFFLIPILLDRNFVGQVSRPSSAMLPRPRHTTTLEELLICESLLLIYQRVLGKAKDT